MRRPVRRTSIVTVAVLALILHQIISVPLFAYGMIRGESSRPDNLLTYVTYILCWPFVLVTHIASIGSDVPSIPNKILISAWLCGPVFWSAVVCIVVIGWREGSQFLENITISSNQSLQP